ncbi:hypothetical protein RUND412_009369 [Rhizina undulata]
MIIFKDVVSGDEMISDVYDLKLVNDVIYEANAQMITIKKGADVDIGANASAEEQAEELEDGAETVNNIVHSFRLNQISFDKKGYVGQLKTYLKGVKKHMEEVGKSAEEIKAFETNAGAFLKDKVLKSFKDWEFYTGESYNPDGMVVLLNYREDGETPYLCFWKHGMSEMKV